MNVQDTSSAAVAICGGIAFFLWGVRLLGDAIKAVGGDTIKTMLQLATRNPLYGVASGFAVTGVAQSITITSVLLLSFIDSNLMLFEEGLAVLLGAGIGSTVISHLVAFKITEYGLHVFVVGYFLPYFLGRKYPSTVIYSSMIMAIGLLLFGQQLVSYGTVYMRKNRVVMVLIQQIDTPILSIIAGFLFTVVVQSSGATTGVVMTMLSSGTITLRTAMALMFGGNIGTCMTALFAASQQKAAALRLAVAFVLMRVVMAFALLPFMDTFIALSSFFSFYDDKASILATGFTLFNVLLAVAFLPVLQPFSRLMYTLVPDVPGEALEGPEIKVC
tara:strand:+ start:79 stop:1071 length:993 start_codon:yes stop_codon:yes gene_type:complete